VLPSNGPPRKARARPGSVDAAIEESRSFAASGNVPPELAGAKMLMLVDRQSGGRLVLTTFDTEEAMRKGDAAMSAGQPRNAGRRSSVEFYEVAVEITAVQARRLTVGSHLLPPRNAEVSALMHVGALARRGRFY